MSLAIITGSNGLVGSETAIFLLEKGFDVIGIDNNERKKLFGKDGDTTWLKKYLKRKYKKYKHYDCDIRDNKKITKIFRYYKKRVEFVLHAAAQPSHDWAYKNIRKDFEINALGTLNILESVKNYSPEAVFIFTSTNKVYGDNPNTLPLKKGKTRFEISNKNKFFKGIDEKFPIDDCTHSFFGVSKTYADLIVQEYQPLNHPLYVNLLSLQR